MLLTTPFLVLFSRQASGIPAQPSSLSPPIPLRVRFMLTWLGPLGFLLEPSYNLVVLDPPTRCIQASRTFINNKLAFLWAPILPCIPRILRSWSPSFASFYLGSSSCHGHPLLLLLPRQVHLGSSTWGSHHPVLTRHTTLFPQSSLLLGWKGSGWQGSLQASHLISLLHINVMWKD